MEREISRKPYVTSDKFFESRSFVYNYGIHTFGYFQAERYNNRMEQCNGQTKQIFVPIQFIWIALLLTNKKKEDK